MVKFFFSKNSMILVQLIRVYIFYLKLSAAVALLAQLLYLLSHTLAIAFEFGNKISTYVHSVSG